jgi:mRNA-degrading endonuclease HigB of HigAB toxin-antitoxin module
MECASINCTARRKPKIPNLFEGSAFPNRREVYSFREKGNRLIASFYFRQQIVFVKFIGTHAEYDAIDPLTVARF